MKNPLIFDIKRGSLDDGDGIRTVIFFKGCPLNCSWCHNPEGIKCEREYFYNRTLCIKCGNCRNLCPTGAYKLVGKKYETSELLSVVNEDSAYYSVSGGGVTFSGGEPTLFMDYLGKTAKTLNRAGVSCTLETCGYFDFEEFKNLVLPYLNCIFYDIKLIDNGEHLKHTGVENHVILKNLELLTKENVNIIPRTPLIPGITDNSVNLSGIESFLKEIGLNDSHVKLAYNDAGIEKKKKFNLGG